MTYVFGRSTADGQSGSLGHFRATDGSRGSPVGLDLETPHVGLVVGKRGFGKSHTLGVVGEELASTAGVGGIVLDPMGGFESLGSGTNGEYVPDPGIRADAIPPAQWCRLLGLDPATGPGALLWRAASTATTVDAMRSVVDASGAPAATRRAVLNHLELAASWNVFQQDGLAATDLLSESVTVLDTAGLAREARAALVFAVARTVYDASMRSESTPLPWLLIDEAHTVTDTIAADAIRTLLTRGRHPGVSIVLATQRPAAIPDVAVSQADLIISHRLTSSPDIEALARMNPTYLDGGFRDSIPAAVGDALVVDDATESAATITVRARSTHDDGASPRASDRTSDARHDPETLQEGSAAGGRSSP